MKTLLGKCLMTHVWVPGNEDRRTAFFLPYEGRLTEKKFEALGQRLMNRISPHMPTLTVEACAVHLTNRARTGKEPFVLIEEDSFGGFRLKGENWLWSGYKENDFEVLN